MSCAWFWEQRGGYDLEIMVMVSSTYVVIDLVKVVLKRTVVGDWQSNNVETIFHLTYNTSPLTLTTMPAQVVEKSFTISSLFKLPSPRRPHWTK